MDTVSFFGERRIAGQPASPVSADMKAARTKKGGEPASDACERTRQSKNSLAFGIEQHRIQIAEKHRCGNAARRGLDAAGKRADQAMFRNGTLRAHRKGLSKAG